MTDDLSGPQPNTKLVKWLLINLVLFSILFSLAYFYFKPRRQVLQLASNYVGYYRGLGLHDEAGFTGRNWFYLRVDEEDGWWEVDFEGYGYAPYRGYYPDGTMREEGLCLVEEFGEPVPDRHNVLQAKYYDPNGTLVSQVNNGTGKQVLFYANGTKSWELDLVDTKRKALVMYYPNGTILGTEQYDPNERSHGAYMSNHRNGNPRMRGEHLHGKQIGIWYHFHEDGSVEEIEDYETKPPRTETFEEGQKFIELDNLE